MLISRRSTATVFNRNGERMRPHKPVLAENDSIRINGVTSVRPLCRTVSPPPLSSGRGNVEICSESSATSLRNRSFKAAIARSRTCGVILVASDTRIAPTIKMSVNAIRHRAAKRSGLTRRAGFVPSGSPTRFARRFVGALRSRGRALARAAGQQVFEIVFLLAKAVIPKKSKHHSRSTRTVPFLQPLLPSTDCEVSVRDFRTKPRAHRANGHTLEQHGGQRRATVGISKTERPRTLKLIPLEN